MLPGGGFILGPGFPGGPGGPGGPAGQDLGHPAY